MRKLLLFFCICFLFCTNSYALVTTTSGAGDWNTGGNWDNGVPGVDDDAVVNHAMTVDGTGATFNDLDNNSTITFTANCTVTIKDAGSIDNTTGTLDMDTNDVNVTFTGSVGATNWTWQIDSGTFDYGSGIHTFENGNVHIANNYTFSQGTYTFNEDMYMYTNNDNTYILFDNNSTVNFTANKTFTLGDTTNIFALRFEGTVVVAGSLGNEITFDGNSAKGYVRLVGTDSLVATFQYCIFDDCYYGMIIEGFNSANDSITLENSDFSNSANDGLFFTGDSAGVLTLTECNLFVNTGYGLFVNNVTTTDVGIILDSCILYSNSNKGCYFGSGEAQGATISKTKMYSNADDGLDFIDNTWTGTVSIKNSLFYENTDHGVGIRKTSDGTIMNCTVANNNNNNIVSKGDGSSSVINIINTICEGSTNGINSVTDPDPVVSYSDVFGASGSNYNGMTDPTGSNGNISVDPLFTNAVGDDYSITTSSPCIGIGLLAGAPADDIDGSTRPMPSGTKPDMGAYEEQTISIFTGKVIIVIN